MIRVHNIRNNGGDDFISEFSIPGWRAFESLVRYELGYGAQLMDATPKMIRVKTRILGSVDVVTFSGPQEEMLPLIQAAAIFFGPLSEGKTGEGFLNAGWTALRNLESPDTEGVRAGFVSWFGPMLVEAPKARVAAITAAKLDEESAKNVIMKGDDDFWTLISWQLQGEDVKELLDD